MSEPITLVKGGEKITVYGLAQASVHCVDGWQATDENVAATISTPTQEPPKVITKKATTRKPRAKATG